MNRPWIYADEVTTPGLYKRMHDKHEYLVELEEIAIKRNIPIHDALRGAQIGNFLVLAPSRGATSASSRISTRRRIRR